MTKWLYLYLCIFWPDITINCNLMGVEHARIFFHNHRWLFYKLWVQLLEARHMTLILPKMSTWNFWNIFSPTVTCTKFKCKNNNKKKFWYLALKFLVLNYKTSVYFLKKNLWWKYYPQVGMREVSVAIWKWCLLMPSERLRGEVSWARPPGVHQMRVSC